MTAPHKTALLAIATALVTSAALAAPNSTPDPVANCYSNATLQFSIDHAQCIGLYPPQATALLAQCETQAIMKYSSAIAACEGKKAGVRSAVSAGLRQNTDSGFLRRLR